MTVVDANVLLYAYNSDAPQQRLATQWLRKLIDSGEIIGLPWPTIWAFVRISTNSRTQAHPLAAEEAFEIVREWLSQPGVVPLHPGPRHVEILEKLVRDYGASGPLLTDAVIAALALENGAVLASTDQGFRRFPDLQWLNPLRP